MSKWRQDIGYEDDSEIGSEEGDILEDIERLLERKLEELFCKLQNLNKLTLTGMQTLASIIPDSTLSQTSLKDQETIKESETKSCQETSKQK